MNMKRFFAAALALCMLISLVPVAPARAAETEQLEFEKISKEDIQLDLTTDSTVAEDMTVEEVIGDDEIVKVIIVMDEESIIEQNSAAVMSAAVEQEIDALEAQQNAVIAAIEEDVLDSGELDVNYQFTWLLNGIAANVPYGAIRDIEAIQGVDRVLLQPVYHVCESVAMPNTISGGAMIGRENTWANGYTGQGMTIAIVDTGLDYDHQNFAPLSEEKLTGDSMTAADISAVLGSLNASDLYAGLTVDDLYYNTKVAYGFNYVDADLDITHADGRGDHGTHVAGIAAANKVDGSQVVGVAPDAQVVVMKVFGKNGGAYPEDIVAALEDALILGVDVVNMSLGSTAGFMDADKEEFDAIYRRVAETGTVLSVSAGNSYTAGLGNMWGTDQNLTQHVDNGLLGSPGVYTNALTVASVENTMVHRYYIAAGDYKMAYSAGSNGYNAQLQTLTEAYGMVVVPGTGTPEDYEGLDVAGKVALVQRGVISFAEKHMYAQAAGAAAIIVYNNVADEEFGMDLTGSDATIPAVSVTLADGEYLKAALAENADFTVSFPTETALLPNPTGYEMSEFSSWGVAPDLTLEPDITAPGGYVYSTVDGGNYGTMSGTSMAAPNIAGLSALVKQYVETEMADTAPEDVRVMVQNLLVSTAAPLVHGQTGAYYSPRQQGAGLANAFNSVTTTAYLTVDGAEVPKVSLYDDPAKTGAYSFAFNVHNFGDFPVYYMPETTLQTEGVAAYDTIYFMAGVPQPLTGTTAESGANLSLLYDLDNDADTDSHDAYYLYRAAQGQGEVEGWEKESFRYDVNGDEAVAAADVQEYLNALVGKTSEVDLEAEVLKVEAGQTAVVNVNVTLSDIDKAYLDTYFPNGGYVEGFTTLTALHHEGVDLSLPYLGFYGDWNDAPLLDDGYYWDMYAKGYTEDLVQPVGNQYVHMLWTQLGGEELSFMPGLNPYIGDETFDFAHVTMSPNGDGSIDTLDDIYVSLMRNVSDITFRFTNMETGEVYYEAHNGRESKCVYDFNYGQIIPYCYSWIEAPMYENTDAEGNVLPNNTQLLLEVEVAGLNEGDENESWSLPITIDVEAPVMESAQVTTAEDGTKILTLSFKDNNSVAAIALLNGSGNQVLAMQGLEDVEPDENGYQNYDVAFDITGLTGKLIIMLGDYAVNESYHGINLGGEGTPYGDLVAYQYNFYTGTNGWVSFNAEVNENETTIFTNFEMDFVAAEYVNGFVYAQTEDGKLYGFKYSDMLNNTMTLEDVFITQLDNVYQDLAYNYVDGKLYGLLTYEEEGYPTTEINSINMRGEYYDENLWSNVQPYQEDYVLSRGGLYGLTMAIDGAGTVYVLGNAVTSTWDENDNQVLIADKTASLWSVGMEYDQWSESWMLGWMLTEIGNTGMSMDYLQSMTWDHNANKLYWARFAAEGLSLFCELIEIDPASVTTDDEGNAQVSAVKVGTLFGETCALFAPLNAETAAKEPYTNVPVMDENVPATPVLRSETVTMSLGGSQTLGYDVDPWFSTVKDMTWSSDNEAVATVDQNGLVTAVGEGSAVITITNKADETKFDTCTIEVSALSLKLEGIVSTMGEGLGNVSNPRIYEYTLVEGEPSMGDKASITASEDKNYGLALATSELGRGSIWASEHGNTGMIYQIDAVTGEVKEFYMPIDGDMVFGMHYSEALDNFTAVENFYLFTDLTMDDAMYEEMENSYNEETMNFEWHRINMLPYLQEAGGSFVTGETGQGASSEVVFTAITGIDGGIQDAYGQTYYYDTYKDYLGNWAMGGQCTYQPAQTLILLDNVGRLWYINEVQGVSMESDEYGNVFLTTADGGMLDGSRPGVIVSNYTAEDGTYTVFHITKIEETPLTEMFREGTMPRITYHFSDIEFAGYAADGLPMIAMSLYDYWNNGTTNELYLYIPGCETDQYDPVTYEPIVIPARLYDLGTTGEYNIVASIHSAEVTGGVDKPENVESMAVNKLTADIYVK